MYHVCPNQTTSRIDMYFIEILLGYYSLKLYQSRVPDIRSVYYAPGTCHVFFCVTCLLCHVFVVSRVCCVTCLLCHVFAVSRVCCVTCLLYHVFVVSRVCCATCLLCHVFVVSRVCCVTCLLCHVFVVSRVCCSLKFSNLNNRQQQNTYFSIKLVCN